MSFSIVIPSRDIGNITACVSRLREKGETARVIVVWDGPMSGINDWFDGSEMIKRMVIVGGDQPFIFSRNSNIGIRAAGSDDVVLMNDDVLLETHGGLTRMARYADGPNCFLSSPRIKGPAWPVHMKRPNDPQNTFSPVTRTLWLPFVCVMIPRKVIDMVGALDEQFVPGGYEDNDYCRRAQGLGVNLIVANDVIVDHQMLPHTFRPEGKPQLYDLAANKERYEDKWRGK